eukprot:1643789-Rhodomonas_salina.4
MQELLCRRKDASCMRAMESAAGGAVSTQTEADHDAGEECGEQTHVKKVDTREEGDSVTVCAGASRL